MWGFYLPKRNMNDGFSRHNIQKRSRFYLPKRNMNSENTTSFPVFVSCFYLPKRNMNNLPYKLFIMIFVVFIFLRGI